MRSRYRIPLILALLATVFAVVFPLSTHAAIRYVSTTGSNANTGTEANPWRDIQYAISTSATVAGDTVIVENGTYVENIVLDSNDLTLASRFLLTNDTNDIANTIIDGDSSGSVMDITADVTVIGFTITNGYDAVGGGINVTACDPILRHLIVEGNEAWFRGGGMAFYNTSGPAIVDHVIVRHNTSLHVAGGGGGVYISDGDIQCSNMTVSYNTSSGNGGGMYMASSSFSSYSNIIVEHNSASSNAGGIYINSANGEYSHIVVQHNEALGHSGGMYVKNFYSLFSNIVVDSNKALGGGGGGIFLTESKTAIDSSFVTNNTAYGDGGGISSIIGALKVSHSEISHNTAQPGGPTVASGGGMYLVNTTPYISNSTISHNSVVDGSGGGMYQIGFREPDPGFDWLPAFFTGAKIGLDSSTVEYNAATEGGGGYYIEGMGGAGLPASASFVPSVVELMYLDHSFIRNNETDGVGGGFYGVGILLSMNSSTVQSNTSQSDGAGGIAIAGSRAVLHHVQIDNNSAAGNGGGLAALDSDVAADSLNVFDNSGDNGGGISHTGTYLLADSSETLPPWFEGKLLGYKNCQINDNTAQQGGGFYVEAAAMAISNCSISDNSAYSNGGGIYAYTSHLILDSTVVDHNWASQNGGGMYATYMNIYSTNATFSYNRASSQNGGGIYHEYDGTAPPTALAIFSGRAQGYFGADISQNRASQSGGGVYFYYANYLLANSTVAHNSCNNQGGGVRFHRGIDSKYPTLRDVVLQDNHALTGGGLVLDYSNATLSNVTVTENTASTTGGGIYTDNSSPVIDGLVVRGNIAGATGGGMYVRACQSTMRNVELRGNTASSNGGGGMYILNSTPVLENFVVSGNLAKITVFGGCFGGGGIFIQSSNSVVIKSSTITGNHAQNGDGGGVMISGSNSTLRMLNSIVWGNAENAGNGINRCSLSVARAYYSIVDQDELTEASDIIASSCSPQFVEPVNPLLAPTTSGNFHLKDYSPAIGTGATSATIGGQTITATLFDIEGTLRGEVPDMGAYENARSTPLSIITAQNDEATVCNDGMVEVDALANDTEGVESPTPIIDANMYDYTQGTRGTVSYDGSTRKFTYTASGLYTGTDTFTYTLSLSDCYTNSTATVVINSDPLTLTPVVAGADTVFSGAQYIYTTPSTSGITYAWSAVNGTVVAVTGNSIAVVWNDTYAGTVVVTTANVSGCSLTDTLAVRIFHPGPVFHVCSSGSNVTGTGAVDAPLATIGMGMMLAQDGDTVLLCPGTYYENVEVRKNIALGSWFMTTGDTSYIAQTVINGGGNGNAVFMHEGLSSTATIAGLTITNGYAQLGGGIYISFNSSPVLHDLVITNNSADNGGGGMYIDYCSPHIYNTTISHNNAAFLGGGIMMNLAAPLLANVTISDNTCEYQGGGICVIASSPHMLNCTIENNISADSDGGGIYAAVDVGLGLLPNSAALPIVSDTSLITIIDGSVIRNNKAPNGNGGGVYIEKTIETRMPTASSISVPLGNPEEISISNTVVSGNYASGNGGGMAVVELRPHLSNMTMIDNSCGGSGGGLYSLQQFFFGSPTGIEGNLRLDSSRIARNISHGNGGGVAIAGSGPCISCLPSALPSNIPDLVYLTANTVDSNRTTSGSGGGLAFTNFAFVGVENSTISHNSAANDGGGIYIRLAFGALEHNAIQYNSANNRGGGMAADTIYMMMLANSFTANRARYGNGGGVYINQGIVIGADSLAFVNNRAGGSGGGIYIGSEIDIELSASTISLNSAQNNGGGIYSASNSAVVSGAAVSGNSASSGGGIFLDGANTNIENAVINSNTATGNGGGVASYLSAPALSNVTIAGNSAGGSGGGVYRYSQPAADTLGEIAGAHVFIENGVISGNFAGSSTSCAGGGGIAVVNVDMPLILLHTTITGNRAPNSNGGGVLVNNAGTDIVNSIVWNNNAASGANTNRCSTAVVRAYHSVVNSADVDSAYALIECAPVFAAPVNPASAPTTTGNFRLLNNSPAIGMGVASIAIGAETINATATDIAGAGRGTVPDIGAYENALNARVGTLTAVDDTVNGCINTPLLIGMLDNDIETGVEIDSVFISSFTQGTSGTVTVHSNPYLLVYTPNTNFIGIDSFTYVASTNACARPDTAVVVVNIGNYPALSISGTNAVCSFSTHTFTVADTNNVTTSYQWTINSGDAVTPAVISGSSTGTSVVVNFGEFDSQATCALYITAVTPNGCQSISVLHIDGYSQPVANAGFDIALCTGTTMAIGTTATGGSGMYSYSWTPIAGLSNPTVAKPIVNPSATMTYTVLVTDKITGCSATDSVTVTHYPIPSLVINTSAACGGQTTTYTVTDTNNTGARMIWHTGSINSGSVVDTSGAMISVLWSSVSETTTRTLTVQAITPEECSVQQTFTITIHPSPAIAINGADSVCSGSMTFYSVFDTNDVGATYEWSVSGGIMVGSPSSTTIGVAWSTVSEGTTGSIALTATSPDGCVVNSSRIIRINTNPVVSITGVDSVFASTEHEYSVVTANSSLTYSWAANGGNVISDPTGATVSIRWSTGSTVTTSGSVTLTATNPEGCSTIVQFPTTIYPYVPVDIAGDSTTVGDTTGVYGVAGIDTTTSSFQWSVSPGGMIVGSATGATITVEWDDVDEPTTGTITVQVLTEDGGTGSTTFTVTIYPRPILTITGDTSVCSEGEYVYSVTDVRNTGSSYGWFITGGTVVGSSTSSTVTVKWNSTTATKTASILVVGYEPHGFDGVTTMDVTVYPKPALMVAGDNSLCGTEAASYIVVDANSTNVTAFTWSVVGGDIIAGQGMAEVVVEWHNVTTATARAISVSGAGMNSCASSTTMNVEIQPLPVVKINGQTELCEQSIAVYSAEDSNAPGTSFVWAVNGGTIISGQNTTTATVLWTTAGTRSVAVTAEAVGGCSTATVLPVDVFSKPQPEITGSREVCTDSMIVLDAGAGYAAYQWSNGAQTRTINVTTGGTYSVVVTSEHGCSTSTSATVVSLLPVVAEAGNDVEICSGASVQLDGIAVSHIGAVEFHWTPSTGLSNPNIANPIATPSQTTTYTLLVADGFGCSSVDQVTVVVKPEPIITITGNTVVCSGGNTQLHVSGGVSYSWSPSVGLSDATSADPIVTPSTTTTYTVTIVSTSACVVQRSVTVTVVNQTFADAGSDVEICAGAAAQLQAAGGVSYSWSPVDGLSNPNVANPIAAPTATTEYTVTVTGTGGCTSTDNVTVTVRPLDLDISVLLEGPYNGVDMGNNLQQQSLLPASQPFGTAPFNYNGTEVIGDSVGSVVDWVLLELRSQTTPGFVIARKAALLRSDGKVVDANGNTPVQIGNIPAGSTPVYVVVWHRNHLPVMSNVQIAPTSVCGITHDFTGSMAAAYSQFMDAQKQLSVAGAPYGLVAGDVDGDGGINASDRVMVKNAAGTIGYVIQDISLDGIVNAMDRVKVRNNTFRVSQVP